MPKVLIIDDEEDIIELLAYHLERKGYAVISVADEDAAIHLAHAEEPDLILINHLPNYADKNLLCKKLRHTPGVQDACLIYLETSMNPKSISCENVDACIYIPLLPEKLIEEIQCHYHRKKMVKPQKEF